MPAPSEILRPIAPALSAVEDLREPATVAAGRIVSRTFESDFNGDGVADERTVISYRYDANGIELGQVIEEDFDADGAIDSRRSTVTAYQPENPRRKPLTSP